MEVDPAADQFVPVDLGRQFSINNGHEALPQRTPAKMFPIFPLLRLAILIPHHALLLLIASPVKLQALAAR